MADDSEKMITDRRYEICMLKYGQTSQSRQIDEQQQKCQSVW